MGLHSPRQNAVVRYSVTAFLGAVAALAVTSDKVKELFGGKADGGKDRQGQVTPPEKPLGAALQKTPPNKAEPWGRDGQGNIIALPEECNDEKADMTDLIINGKRFPLNPSEKNDDKTRGVGSFQVYRPRPGEDLSFGSGRELWEMDAHEKKVQMPYADERQKMPYADDQMPKTTPKQSYNLWQDTDGNGGIRD